MIKIIPVKTIPGIVWSVDPDGKGRYELFGDVDVDVDLDRKEILSKSLLNGFDVIKTVDDMRKEKDAKEIIR